MGQAFLEHVDDDHDDDVDDGPTGWVDLKLKPRCMPHLKTCLGWQSTSSQAELKKWALGSTKMRIL